MYHLCTRQRCGDVGRRHQGDFQWADPIDVRNRKREGHWFGLIPVPRIDPSVERKNRGGKRTRRRLYILPYVANSACGGGRWAGSRSRTQWRSLCVGWEKFPFFRVKYSLPLPENDDEINIMVAGTLDRKQKRIIAGIPPVSDFFKVYFYTVNSQSDYELVMLLDRIIGLNDSVLADWLNITPRTFRNYKHNAEVVLKGNVKEHIVLLLSLYKHGMEVF